MLQCQIRATETVSDCGKALRLGLSSPNYIALPRNRSAARFPVVLAEDGSNYSRDRHAVSGSRGDLRRDENGVPVTRVVPYGA